MIGILSAQLVVSQQSSGTSGRSVHVSVHSELCPLDRPLDFLVGRDLSLPLSWHLATDQDAGSEIPHPTSVPSGRLVLGVVPQLGNQ